MYNKNIESIKESIRRLESVDYCKWDYDTEENYFYDEIEECKLKLKNLLEYVKKYESVD